MTYDGLRMRRRTFLGSSAMVQVPTMACCTVLVICWISVYC